MGNKGKCIKLCFALRFPEKQLPLIFSFAVTANQSLLLNRTFECQAEKGTKKVPVHKKNEPKTHPFQNLWSSSRGGRKCGGGWDVKAFKYYNDMIRHLKTIQEKEATENNPRFQKGLEVMRLKHKKRMEKGLPKRRAAKKHKPGKRSSNTVVIEIVDE